MKTQKLSLHDFEAVETVELLQIKGGKTPPGYIVKWEDATLNDGVDGGCPKCKEAYQNEGTPIPRRCNGSSHFSGSLAGAWDSFWNDGNFFTSGTSAIISLI